jgi:hypothetical protein
MSNTLKNENCESRIDPALAGRLSDLRTLWERYRNGKEQDDDFGTLADYGLSFDYVAPDTFNDQREGYFRYQISWGGPSDEFRFFANPDGSCHRVEYWFMDWFDGACRVVTGDDEKLILAIWEWFRETGTTQAALDNA